MIDGIPELIGGVGAATGLVVSIALLVLRFVGHWLLTPVLNGLRGPLHPDRRTLRASAAGHHLQPGLLPLGAHLCQPMAAPATFDRVVHRSVTRELDAPSY